MISNRRRELIREANNLAMGECVRLCRVAEAEGWHIDSETLKSVYRETFRAVADLKEVSNKIPQHIIDKGLCR